jgi:proliferating cell nuclear antigen
MNICINQIQKAEIFAGVFQHIKAFTEQVNIMFEKDRMYIQTMDGSHVSIIEMMLPNNWFDEYSHKEPGTIKIGVHSTMLFKVLSAREKTQNIQIEYDTNDSDKLCIHFTSENKVEFDKHFELPLIDLDYDIMAIPAVNHQAEFSLSSPHFASLIHQLQMFGDSLDINCNENKIMLCSRSVDQGKMYVEIKIDDLSSFIIDENCELNLSYSLQYLHNVCLYNKLAKEINIKISENYPIQIVYYLDDSENHDARVVFYLAPKIQDDD